MSRLLTLLVHFGESRPQPLVTVSLCRRLLEEFLSSGPNLRRRHHEEPGLFPASVTPMLRKVVEEGGAAVLVYVLLTVFSR